MWSIKSWRGNWSQVLLALLLAAPLPTAASRVALAGECRQPHFWEVGCCVYNECPVGGDLSQSTELKPGCTLLGDSPVEGTVNSSPSANAKPVKRPQCDITDHAMDRVVGYYEGRAARRTCHSVNPYDIARGVYTHLNFASATLDPKTFEVQLLHERDYILYRDLVALKEFDGNLKVFLSVGSWNHDEHDGATSVMTTFSQMVASAKSQKRFFSSLVGVLDSFGFDGVDIHWPYPGQIERGGSEQDYDNFPGFIANLKRHLDKKSRKRNGLSVAVPLQRDTLKYFDVPKLQPNVDFFNMLPYKPDLGADGQRSMVLQPHVSLTDTQAALDSLWRESINPEKIALGVSFGIRKSRIADSDCTSPGCASMGAFSAEKCSDTVGYMLPAETKDLLKFASSAAFGLDKEAGVKYSHGDKRWLSYEDSDSLQLKTDLARSQCLGGVLVWSVGHDYDDARLSNQLAQLTGYRSHHPLMHDNDEILAMARMASAAKKIIGPGRFWLNHENPSIDVPICGHPKDFNDSPLFRKILCDPYPAKRYRKVSTSAADHPQVPGGYRTPYGSQRIRPPAGSTVTPTTTDRCGKWHVASEGETGTMLLQRYDIEFLLLVKANPSLRRSGSSLNELEPGVAYCVAPMKSFDVAYRDFGCYYNINREVMPVMGTFTDPRMTVDKCASFCMVDTNYAYFGVTKGRVCMCGPGVHFETTKVKDKYCKKPCGGNKDMMCGGKGYTRLYSNSKELYVYDSPEDVRPEGGDSFFRGGGGGCGGGMKDAWGGPGS